MYGAEAADVYDALHSARGKDFVAEATEVAELIRSRAPAAGSLLDVACGTGGHLRVFRDLFDEVAGVDAAEPMLARARRRLPGIVLRHGDMRDFTMGRSFDAVTCLFSSIGYLHTTEDLTVALRRFADHLAPGGVVVVEPWWFPETFLPGYVASDVVTVDDRTIARMSHSVRDGDCSVLTVHYLVGSAPNGVRHFTETHRLRLFTQTQYETAFTQAGLRPKYLRQTRSDRGLFVAVPR